MVTTFPYKQKQMEEWITYFLLGLHFLFLDLRFLVNSSQISINYLLIIATFFFWFENQIVVSFSEISIEFPILIYTY